MKLYRRVIIVLIILVSFMLGMVLGAFLSANVVYAYEYSPTDIVMIGKVAQHECGNQSELGKRLMIDTILNRVESADFPNTVEDVINQKGQYCNPSEYPPRNMYRIVAEEIYIRTNSKVLWYKTKGYHKYGTPIMQEGNHYFSGID